MLNINIITLLITLLVPVNLVCSFWIFREMLNLSGVLYSELNYEISGSYSSPNRKHNEKNMILAYLLDRSSDIELTLKLSRWYLVSLIPSALSFIVTLYVTISDNEKELQYALMGIIALIVVNILILACRGIYREKHPLDDRLSVTLEEKKREYRSNSSSNIIQAFIYIFAIALMTTMIFIGNSVIIGLDRTSEPENPTTNQTDIIESQDAFYDGEFVNQMPTYSDVIRVLEENGFEIKNTSALFSHIEGEHITNSFVSENTDTRFEYYEYSVEHLDINDYEIISNSIWEEICKDTAPDSEFFGTDSLIRGGVSRCIVDSDYLKALYWKENTIIYICSERNSMSGIEDKIIYELGYI